MKKMKNHLGLFTQLKHVTLETFLYLGIQQQSCRLQITIMLFEAGALLLTIYNCIYTLSRNIWGVNRTFLSCYTLNIYV